MGFSFTYARGMHDGFAGGCDLRMLDRSYRVAKSSRVYIKQVYEASQHVKSSHEIRSGRLPKSSQAKPSQAKPSQVKSSQVKSSQVKSSQVKSNQVKSIQAPLPGITAVYGLCRPIANDREDRKAESGARHLLPAAIGFAEIREHEIGDG